MRTMGSCKIFLNNQSYYPGQTVNGYLECCFTTEETVRAIRIRFRGRSKVQWSEGRNHHYRECEEYFKVESNLLTGETTFPPGTYLYPLQYDLPTEIPPSLTHLYGNIKYSVLATVDRPWAIDYKAKELFLVHSYTDLNNEDYTQQSVCMTETKKPFALFNESGPITITMQLPLTGYVPNQMVIFRGTVKNESTVDVQSVCFKIVQGLVFSTKMKEKRVTIIKGQEFEVVGSFIPPKNETSWDLELQVPPDVYAENLFYSANIKSFVELKGKVVLPSIHRNLKIAVPLTIGTVPLRTRC